MSKSYKLPGGPVPMNHTDALKTWEDCRIAAARDGTDVVLPQTAADGLESLLAQLLLLAIPGALSPDNQVRLPADPGTPAVRPPGQWHCGHWREASGPCCGCGKPVVPGDVEPGPCPGGKPWC